MSDDGYLDAYQPAAVPAAAPDYLSAYKPPADRAREVNLAVANANPEEAAKAFGLAPKVGLPPAIVQLSTPQFQEKVERDSNNALTDSNIRLANFVSDPAKAAAVKDDYEALNNLSSILDPGGFVGQEGEPIGKNVLAESIASGYSHQNYARLATRYQFGADVEPQLRQYETEFQKEQRYEGFDKYVSALGGFIGSTASSAQAGAVTGAIGGAIAGPAGAAAGFGAGFIGDMFITTSGQTYRRLDLVRDADGKAIPESIKQAAALTAGSIGMGLGIGLGGLGGKLVGNLVSSGVVAGLSRVGVADAIARGVGGTLSSGITGGSINAGIALSQEITPILAQRFSGLNINDPGQWDRVKEVAEDAFVNGALIFGGMHGGVTAATALPYGANWLKDRATNAQARSEGEQRLSILGAMQVGKTGDRSPELLHEFIAAHDYPDVHVPASEVAANREAFGYIPDLDQQLAHAGAVGGDVVIPAADYFVKTPEEVQKAINPKVKGLSGISPEEADHFEQNPPDYATVYHGSPYSFEVFDESKVGTGEGVAAFGYGAAYMAERRGIAEDYRKNLAENNRTINGEPLDPTNSLHAAVTALENSGDIEEAIGAAKDHLKYAREGFQFAPQVSGSVEEMTSQSVKFYKKVLQHLEDDKAGKAELPSSEASGHLYQAKIMRPKEHFLDWDVPLEQQSPYVQEALKGYAEDTTFPSKTHGGDMYEWITQQQRERIKQKEIAELAGLSPQEMFERNKTPLERADRAASKALSDAGIAGIKYLDAASRGSPVEIAGLEERIKGLKASIKETEGNLETTEHKEVVQESLTNLNQILERAEKALAEANNPTRNYVVFKAKDILITHKNDVARQIEEALERTTEQIEASMGLRKSLEAKEGKSLWLDPLIEPKAAGTPQAVFRQLSKHIQEMQREITQKAYDVAEREIKKRETPLWKAKLADEVEATRAEMEGRPDFKAWFGLVDLPKDDPFSIKLDRNEVDALYNRESPADYAAFQKDGTRASESFPKKMFEAGGATPDEAAEMFGYNSGKEMLDAMRQHQANIEASGKGPKAYFDKMIKDEATNRLELRDGKLQDVVMREALEMALDVRQVDVLGREIELLGGEKITKQKMIDRAADVATRYRASEMKSSFFMKETGKFGEAAYRAAVKGDYVEALENKHRQLISFLMAREAKAFERDQARLDKLIDKYGAKANIESVDQIFTDQIHNVMAQMGERVPRSAENLREALLDKNGQLMTLRRFSDELSSKLNLEVPVGEALDNLKERKDMSVGEVRQVKDTLTSLDKHGRDINTIIVAGKKELIDRIIEDKILPNLDDQAKKINEDTRTAIGQLKTTGRWIDASLLKAEQLFQWLDKNDALGPLTSLVYRPLKQAEYNFLDHYAAFAEDWNKNVPIDKAWKKSLNKKTKNTVLTDDDEKPMTLYRDQMVAMAANVGNDWNMRVLAKGRNWHPDDVMQYLHENMTKQDWDVVQSIWDRFERLWPDVREASKQRSGVAIERIPSRTVTTPFGDYKGGYYPLIAEPRAARTLREKAFGFDAGSPFLSLTSISNATNARTGATYPVDLSLDRLPYTIRETLHEIHFGQALTDAAKIIQDPLILKGIDKAMGKEYSDSLKPWFSYVATDGGTPDPAALGWLTRGSRFLRQNMVTQLVGFRPSTGFIHGMSAAANSWTEIGKASIGDQKYLREALSLLSRDPATGERYFRQFAEESGELRNRFHNMDRDLGAVVMRDLRSPSGIGVIGGDQYDRAAYQALATKHIAYLDYMSAVTVYAAKRAEALAKGLSLEDAIFSAEQTVRNAHGSAGLLDLPAIARGAEGWKWFTTFYGYFNHNYQRLRDTGRFMQSANYVDPATYWQIVSRSMGYLIAPAIVHEIFRAPPPAPDESYLWWVSKGIGTQVTGGLPFVRDVAHAVVQGKLPDQATPMSEVMKGLVQSGVDLHKFVMGDRTHPAGTLPKDWVAKAIQTPGWWTGHLPGVTGTRIGRVAAGLTTKTGSGAAQYLWDSALEVPDSWDADYWRLIMDGNYHPRKGH